MAWKERWICASLLIATALLLAFGSTTGRDWVSVFSSEQTCPTLVIDAGHGGFDGGAVGSNGTTEQDINLNIARSLQALAQCFGYSAKMTREDEQALDYVEGRSIRENKVADIKARERIAEETEHAVFLSVHLNKFEDPQYFAAQVYYSINHADSQVLAEEIQQCLIDGIQNNNIRRAKPAAAAIYLMKNLQCPAIIVECGFLSNPEEEAALCDPAYQKRLAICIFKGYELYQNGAKNEAKNTVLMQ